MKNFLMCLFTIIISAVGSQVSAQLQVRDHEYYNYDHGKEREAQLAAFEERIKKAPNDATIYYERGKLYERGYSYREAEKDYSKAIALDPKYKDALLARAALREHHLSDPGAIEDYKSAFVLAPEAWIKAQIARLYIVQGNFVAAEESYTIAIELRVKEEGRPDIYYLQERMNIRTQLEDYKGAVEDCDEILKIDARQHTYLLARADIKLNKLKDYKDALTDYNELLKKMPDANAVLHSRGVTKYKLNDINGAFTDLLEAGARGHPYTNSQEFYDLLIAEHSTDSRAYLARGLARMSARMDDDALLDIETALKYNPKYPEAWFFKGKIMLELSGNPREALEAFKKAEMQGYKNAELYFHRGKARKMLLDDKGALQEFNLAIREKLSHGQAWHQRIELKRKMGDNKGADADERTLNSLISEYGYNNVYRVEYF